ncbi:MAG: ABC transporter substrate-binding protein [Planctomycetota bacterium]|jgi:ABC-type Fe3+-hydroxamate transport system substrate-binding protein
MKPAVLLCLLLWVLGAGGCGGTRPMEATVPSAVTAVRVRGDTTEVVYEDGRVLHLPSNPTRIASTLPGITETLVWFGAADRLVAVSPHCVLPPEVGPVPTVSVMPVNYEAMAAAAPELILADATLQRSSVAELERHFSAVLPLDSRSLDGLAHSIDVLAQILGTPEARRRSLEFRGDLDAARADVRPAGSAPPGSALLAANVEPLYALGPGSLLDDMVRACGYANVADDLGRPSGPFSEELVMARRPDWILITGEPLPAAILARWRDVPAVAEGRVASARADDLVRAGPRIPGALRRLGKVLRGDLPPAALAEAP